MNNSYYKGIIYFPNDFYYEKENFDVKRIEKHSFVYSIIESVTKTSPNGIGDWIYVGLYSDKYYINKIGRFKIYYRAWKDNFEETLNYYGIVLIRN